MEDLKEQQKTVEKEVQRYHEREQLKVRELWLERKKPWLKYEEFKGDVREAENKHKKAKTEREKYEKENKDPLKDKIQ